MPYRFLPRLLLQALACVLLASCAGEPFKPCEVSVEGVRAGKNSASRLLSALLGQAPDAAERQHGPAGLEFVVLLKVVNPNDREVVLRGLSGVVSGPGGELGAFRLPEDKPTPLPARGTAVVEILAEPGGGLLRNALPLLSASGRAQLKATGHADVDTWLGVRRVEFKDVRLAGGGGARKGADSAQPEPARP